MLSGKISTLIFCPVFRGSVRDSRLSLSAGWGKQSVTPKALPLSSLNLHPFPLDVKGLRQNF